MTEQEEMIRLRQANKWLQEPVSLQKQVMAQQREHVELQEQRAAQQQEQSSVLIKENSLLHQRASELSAQVRQLSEQVKRLQDQLNKNSQKSGTMPNIVEHGEELHKAHQKGKGERLRRKRGKPTVKRSIARSYYTSYLIQRGASLSRKSC